MREDPGSRTAATVRNSPLSYFLHVTVIFFSFLGQTPLAHHHGVHNYCDILDFPARPGSLLSKQQKLHL
ncbi:hypothetical protein FHG87_004111 [Trinorchestia longiramus]|nr:hypothetical protein FHG87_004111 [Trinorchestia longiramus]